MIAAFQFVLFAVLAIVVVFLEIVVAVVIVVGLVLVIVTMIFSVVMLVPTFITMVVVRMAAVAMAMGEARGRLQARCRHSAYRQHVCEKLPSFHFFVLSLRPQMWIECRVPDVHGQSIPILLDTLLANVTACAAKRLTSCIQSCRSPTLQARR